MSIANASLPAHVGVIGGGRMGAGIAHVLAVAGSSVTVVETDAQAVGSTRDRLTRSLARAAKAEGPHFDVLLARIELTSDLSALSQVTVVIEAVPEDIDLKVSVLARTAEVAPNAVLATNTSALSIDALATRLDLPERVVGLHFFNPVPTSALVEIVRGTKTSPALIANAQRWVAALGKTAIVVQDSPGFASSRLGLAIALEAIRMLEQGVSTAEDIDSAMSLGYRHPVGPLRTTDMVGLDVRLAIAEHLSATLGPRFDPPTLLLEKVSRGELGRKTGQGFFPWT
jgi:3-hydroxybutyryl-CoA dehydrogenase